MSTLDALDPDEFPLPHRSDIIFSLPGLTIFQMDSNRFYQLTCSILDIKHGTLDDTDLERFCPLDHGHHRADATDSVYGLGTLGILPHEILYMIFSQLDIQSLFSCRRLSRQAMSVINSVQEYRDLIHFIPNAVRGVLSIESGSHITCKRLHAGIFKSKCPGEVLDYPNGTLRYHQCDTPAQFICVLTGKRWCLRHMSVCNRRDHHLPLFAEEVAEVFGLSVDQISGLPSFKSIPGHYSPDAHTCEDRLHFIDGPSAYTKAVETHGSAEGVGAYQRLRLLEGLLSRRILLPTRWEDLSSISDVIIQNCVRDSYLPLSWNIGRLRTRRFMTVVLAPLLDRRERIPRWGRYCISCQDKDFRCWDTHKLDSLEEHLAEHKKDPCPFPTKVPLHRCDTLSRAPQFNNNWPHVERRLVCRTGSSVHPSQKYWTHEEILASWNGNRFR